MSTVRYVLIDTQIWIYCLLASQKGANKRVLSILEDRINDQSLRLILPETVRIEFEKLVKKSREDFVITFKKAEKELTALAVYPTYETSIRKRISNLKRDMNAHFDESLLLINNIFSNTNIIKTHLTTDILLNSYIRGMRDEKPYKPKSTIYNSTKELEQHWDMFNMLQNDCLIIEECIAYLKGKKKYEFIICSNNRTDFSVSNDCEIHPDIAKDFLNVKLYDSLATMLNTIFNENIPPIKVPNASLNSVSSTDTVGISVEPLEYTLGDSKK